MRRRTQRDEASATSGLRSVDHTGTLDGDAIERLDDALDAISVGTRLALLRLVGEGRPRPEGATRAFSCVRLNQASVPTTQMFLLKLGRESSLADEFEKWSRYLFPRAPVMLRPHGEVLLSQMIGDGFVDFSKIVRTDLSLLRDAVPALFDEWLRDLHGHFEQVDHGLPADEATQRATLLDSRGDRRPRIDARDRRDAAEQLAADLGASWMQSKLVEDHGRGYALVNWVQSLVEGTPLPGDEWPCALPRGIIHGDLNFDNLFVSPELLGVQRSTRARMGRQPNAEQAVAVIDYEHLGDGCVFDDLVRLECELLVSALPVGAARTPFADTALVTVAACWPWDLVGALPAGLTAAEQDVYRALATVRSKALAIADATAVTDHGALERGYFACLLGRAFSYLRYPHVTAVQRPRAAELCLLIGQRLADERCELALPRFPDVLRIADAGGGTASPDVDAHGHVLDGTAETAAVQIAHETIGDVRVIADLTIESVPGEHCKIGVVKGALASPPPGSVVARGGVGAWVSLARDRWLLHLEPQLSADPHRGTVLSIDAVGQPLQLQLRCTGSSVSGSFRIAGAPPVELEIEFRPSLGSVYVAAEGCRARLRGLQALTR